MIIVRVELLSAFTGKTTELARMHIANTGEGTATRGDYEARVLRGRSKEQLDRCWASGAFVKQGQIKNHARLSSHVWNLVGKALAACGYETT